MQKPKILLLGVNGQVGYELCRKIETIGELIALERSQADFSHPLKVVEILNQYQPHIIINAVAYTAVDKAEEEAELAYQVNKETPQEIARYAKKHNCLLIHYSTDFVFDGLSNSAYVENSQTAPLSIYGKSKLAGDEAILDSGCASVILRTSWVYGLRGKNFLLTIRNLATTKEQLAIVDDQIGSPTWCGFIAQATKDILLKILHQMDKDFDLSQIPENYLGLFNLSASNSTSWYQFARELISLDPNKANHICKQILPIPSSDYPTPAHRPEYSVLDNAKIANIYAIKVPTWEQQLKKCQQND
ncbi:MAG: dTDP-4-dehydrorhamnose reductase [Gammaproteobacteria bacterium]|nr:dTDP-4-dehydrorhamnose reductase [Gammaproteobacteria bacterium]